MATMRRCPWPALAGLLALSLACDLQEVTIAEPARLVVAEIVLQTGVAQQRALLYRTRGGTDDRVPDAIIEVRAQRGGVLRFQQDDAFSCLDLAADEPDPGVGTCYTTSLASSLAIEPGETYDLRITLDDGGVMTARTTVPADFAIALPAAAACVLPPDSALELRWTRSDGAWAYVAETSLDGIRAALDARGVDIDRDPLRLLGLAITQEDTTIVFPSEFGLFDRAEPALAAALLAIRDGLPPGVVANTIIAAVDRNWVNWARGGNFNPSGIVRVPSIQGDGTGVFGSFVVQRLDLSTRPDDALPACR